jgi:ATP/maltotriose-dependent transcriptional regulator MalT
VDDPAAQLAALRARLLANQSPETARDLATWVMVRPPPMLAIRGARIALDTCAALAALGDTDGARTVIKRALKTLQGAGTDGLVLELLLSWNAAAPDARVQQAAGQIASRLASNLPPAMSSTFRSRAAIRSALGAG